MINTYSLFYYGHAITEENNLLDFDEGGGELTAELNPGDYTLTEFLVELKRAMDAIGALTYTVSVDRATRLITIAGSGAFSLLITSGTHVGTSVFTLAGFTGADVGPNTTFTGNAVTGSEYEPPFYLQDYIDDEDWQQSIDASVNKTASGKVEVIRFGTEKLLQMEISWVTDNGYNAGAIKSTSQPLTNLRTFMRYITQKNKFEFMPDIDDPDTFKKVLLESTPESKTGTGYKLQEMYDRGLPGWYRTGTIKLRIVED